ncbi:hypothetical protein HNE05_20030 [Aquipseudomonas campi]|uniref:YcxB-like protein domain-containing protein n=1 Tax=Aquipseudomonas campi TaxID=2731681 RepID=A0A6M8FNI5_9GAMM|nr:hypothetical protein [Pseudomonas campi]QKE65550.1 hypothetical protein HNE05_20030 [Pseudomonas campi]
MELRFSMDAAELHQLTEDIIACRLASHEQTFERLAHWQARLLAPLTLGLIVLLLALLPLLVQGGYSAPSSIATLLVIGLVLLLWRRVAAPWLQRAVQAGQPRSARIRQHSAARLERSLRQQLSKSLPRLRGLHVWTLEEQGVLVSTPDGQQQRIAWGQLECVAESAHFYRLASRAQQRLGLAYTISKHSCEMDAATYRAGLAQLLAHCHSATRQP